MFREIPLPYFMSDSGSMLNSFWALILVNTAFQMGFCTFVLSNYMKTLPYEIYESAELDGASVWRQYWQLTMPLVRPALAALATLQVTWVYNEFFWATVLIQQGDKLPVTSALNNLRGQFFTDTNLVAAGSIIVALPVLVVFFALQKQFVSGLTLGLDQGLRPAGGQSADGAPRLRGSSPLAVPGQREGSRAGSLTSSAWVQSMPCGAPSISTYSAAGSALVNARPVESIGRMRSAGAVHDERTGRRSSRCRPRKSVSQVELARRPRRTARRCRRAACWPRSASSLMRVPRFSSRLKKFS